MKRRSVLTWILGIVLFSLIVLATGCGGRSKTAQPTAAGSISGIVSLETLDAQPGDPGNILIYLKERPDHKATTTSLGSYTISSVPPGTYTVVLELPAPPPGAVYVVQPTGGEWKNVQVLSGLQTINVDFEIEAVPAPPEW